MVSKLCNASLTRFSQEWRGSELVTSTLEHQA